MTASNRNRMRQLRLTEALRPFAAAHASAAAGELAQCDLELAANEVLFRRDYPFVLYPENKLKAFCTQFLV